MTTHKICPQESCNYSGFSAGKLVLGKELNGNAVTHRQLINGFRTHAHKDHEHRDNQRFDNNLGVHADTV